MRGAPRSVLAILIAAVAAGCGLLPQPDAALPIENLDVEPRRIDGAIANAPTGPNTELLRGFVAGDRLALVAQRDGDGICLAVWRGAHGGTMCGDLPGGDGMGPIGPTMVTGQDAAPFEVIGIAVPEAAEVVLELDDDRRARAVLVSLGPVGVAGNAFIVHLARAQAHALVALDADGAEIARLTFSGP
jgi:hypothetical protein